MATGLEGTLSAREFDMVVASLRPLAAAVMRRRPLIVLRGRVLFTAEEHWPGAGGATVRVRRPRRYADADVDAVVAALRAHEDR